MSTTWTNENLNDYLDNRLNAADREKLESIIRKDAVAIDALRELRRVRVTLRKAPRFQLNNDFAARVVASLDKAVDQPALERLTDTSGNDSVVALASPASQSSVSATTWRTIAICMTAIAASLVLIILIRPPLSGAPPLAQTPPNAVPDLQIPGSSSLTNPASAESTNGATAGSVANSVASSAGNVSESGANQDDDASRSVEEPREVNRDRPANEDLSPGDTDDSSADGQLNEIAGKVENTQSPSRSSPGSLSDSTESDLNSTEETTGPDTFVQDLNTREQNGWENDDVRLPEVAPPFQFDEVVILTTTRNQMDTMLGVLNDDPIDQELVEGMPAANRGIHGKAQEGLGGGKDKEEPGNNPSDVVVSVGMGGSTLVMSIEATPEQLDDFLAQFGAPASRINEQLPMQSLSVNELLARNDNPPDDSAGSGAGGNGAGMGLDPGGNNMEKGDAEKLAITVIGGDVLSQKQTNMNPLPPQPEATDKVDSPSAPVVRRYLIVVKAQELP